MVVVIKKKGETKDSMFRKFTKAFIEENIVDEVRKRQFYKKPSLVRKEKEKERLQRRYKN
ncbi:MAG: 30S ribosomal protein S21 [Patescibacteria group bacterium]